MLVYSLSLWHKLIMHTSVNAEKKMSMLFTNLCLFWTWRWWLVHQNRCLLLAVSYPYIITCDYLWKELLVSFKPLVNVLTCVNAILLFLLAQQTRHELGGNLPHVQTVFKNILNRPRWNVQHVSKFMGCDSSVLEDEVLPSIHILCVFLIELQKGHTTFECGEPL